MRELHEMAADIRDRLTPEFPTVRLSTATLSSQLLNELKAIGASKLPAVVVIIDQGVLTTSNFARDDRVTLMLIDKFVAASDDKALSALAALGKLFQLFPADVSEIKGVNYLPVRFYSASADPGYACVAYELIARQGVI